MSYRRIGWLCVLAAAFTVLLVALNPQYLPVELLIAAPTMPLGAALALALAAGVALGVLMRAAWLTELLAERGRLRRALKAAEARLRQRD